LPNSKRVINGKYAVYGANGEKCRTNEFFYDRESIIVGRKGSAGELTLTENKFWPLDVSYYVKFDNKQYSLKFIYRLLQTLNLPQFAKGVKPGINRNEVYELAVRVPKMAIQQKIVSKLDNLSEKTKKFENIYKTKLNNLQELKKAALQKEFLN
jgi:type I restriction enzyme S subunit